MAELGQECVVSYCKPCAWSHCPWFLTYFVTFLSPICRHSATVGRCVLVVWQGVFLVICLNQPPNLSHKNQFIVYLHKAMGHDKAIPELVSEPEVV